MRWIVSVLLFFSAAPVEAQVPCSGHIWRYIGANAQEVAKARLDLMTCLARMEALEPLAVAEAGASTGKSYLLVDKEPVTFALFVEDEDGFANSDTDVVMYSCKCPGGGSQTGYEGFFLGQPALISPDAVMTPVPREGLQTIPMIRMEIVE